MSNKIFVAVFCYNRPGVLQNCLESIRTNITGADVHVFDDHSVNPKMAPVLAACGFPVHTGPGAKGRHGGLYRNMQMAYEMACEGGYDFLINIQDDMQLVRPFDDAVQAEYAAYFDAMPNLTQVDVRFQRQETTPKINRDMGCYVSLKSSNIYNAFADVGVFHIGRLKAADWKFDRFENKVVPNEVDLAKLATKNGFLRCQPFTPIAAQVPFPDLYRHGIRLPRLSGLSGKIYRFEQMSAEARRAMDARDLSVYPKIRAYLQLENLNAWDRWLIKSSKDSKIF